MNIFVIGGGASGLMAGIHASEGGNSVTILEQNDKIGKKLLATGNGRSNLTNTVQNQSCYRSEDPEFAWNLIKMFGLADTLRFFTMTGIYTKNKNGWIYPYSEQASSVLDILRMEALHRKVKIKTREEVVSICPMANGFSVATKTWTYQADKVILAAGSPASVAAGSGGSGYRLAEALGHTLVKPLPALVPLRCVGDYFSKWAGVRMDCSLSLFVDDKPVQNQRGEVQFTDYGLSGIPVFQLSRYAVRALYRNARVLLLLDLMPDFTLEGLIRFLYKRMEDCPYKTMEEMLIGLFPHKMATLLGSAYVSVSELALQIKEYPLPVKSAHSMEQAQVCSGGLSTQEINPKTLESKLIPGLYFTGEVIDVDGECGGYNLQWAWTSGAIAGKSATQK